MLLNPEYTYLFLDFETTGLDTIKDDPIQIGLLLLDHEGNTLRTYSSPLRPSKPISELKSIVTYLTQISLEQLQNAPSMPDILHELAPFLWPKTVLIGHNISFDLAFLKRYTDRTPLHTIDTFPLCKMCVHFLPSYALEVIANHLQIRNDNAHDALADCEMNAAVFLHCIRHLHKLRTTYLIFDYILQNSPTTLATILHRTAKSYNFSEKTLFLPPLHKPSQATKKIIQPDTHKIQPDQFGTASQYFLGGSTLSSFLSQIKREKTSRLLCFSHKSKLHIADQVLSTQGVQTSLLSDAYVFLPERIDLLLRKGSFDEGELSFLTKYLSHHLQAHTLIDINSSDDYKLFNALTEPKPPHPGQVMLATHEQLYAYTHPLDPRTHILFFDAERWRQTRGTYTSTPLDPHHLLQYLDHAAYKASLLHEQSLAANITEVITQLNLAFGIISGEIDNLFTGYPHSTLEIENILTHTRLPHSKAVVEKLLATTFFTDRNDELAHWGAQLRERLQSLFEGAVIVTKAMYQGDKRWYTFASPQGFHTFGEMKERLPPAVYSFLSTLNSNATPIGHPLTTTPLTMVEKITHPAQLLNQLETFQGNIFLLTSSKSHAQDLFQQLIRANKETSWLVVGENITWGVGKIVYLATQSKKPVIMMGWFGCYLAARAKRFAISTVIIYHCEGKQKPLLVADIQFYRASS